MSNAKMFVPTIRQIDQIMAKVRQLDREIDEMHRPPDDPIHISPPSRVDLALDSLYDELRGADDDWPPIEWFVRRLGGRDVPLDREPADIREATAAVILASGNTERIVRYLMEQLPKLSDSKLYALRDKELTPLLKDMLTGVGGVPNQALLDLSTAIDQQTEENWRLAEECCRHTYINPLIHEIERMLFPFTEYIRAITCCKPDATPRIVELVRSADHGALRDAIVELGKIKYRVQIEAERQMAPEVGVAGKQTKRKPGRPKVADDPFEVERRGELRDEWEQAKGVGISKSEFCRDKKIDVTELDAALRYCREHSTWIRGGNPPVVSSVSSKHS